jgi:hypothetical protein
MGLATPVIARWLNAKTLASEPTGKKPHYNPYPFFFSEMPIIQKIIYFPPII